MMRRYGMAVARIGEILEDPERCALKHRGEGDLAPAWLSEPRSPRVQRSLGHGLRVKSDSEHFDVRTTSGVVRNNT